MIDITTLSDDELALACDEYVQRAMQRMRASGYLGDINIWIIAMNSAYCKDKYTISHQLDCGEVKLKSANLFELVDKQKAINNIPTSAPTQVTPMLPAPISLPAEDAQFSEELDDTVPF